MLRYVPPTVHLLHLLPYPWKVAVLLLVLAALAVRWHRSRAGRDRDATVGGEPYGRVVPLTLAERSGWSPPSLPPGSRTPRGEDA